MKSNLKIIMIDSSEQLNCHTLYSHIRHFIPYQVITLQCLSILSLVSNAAANTIALILIIKTNQYRNTSVRIIYYLTISNCAVALVNVLFTIYTFKQNYSCTYELVTQFFNSTFSHSSAYFVVLIAYDRYLRIKYLQRYAEIMTKRKVDILILIMCILAFIQGGTITLESLYPHLQLLIRLRLPIDALAALLTIWFYLKTIFMMKLHKRRSLNKEIFQQVDTTVTKLSSVYLLFVILFYIPCIVAGVLKKIFKTEFAEFCYVLTLIMVYNNSFATGFMFLKLNRQANQLIRTMFKTKQKNVSKKMTTDNSVLPMQDMKQQKKNAVHCTQSN